MTLNILNVAFDTTGLERVNDDPCELVFTVFTTLKCVPKPSRILKIIITCELQKIALSLVTISDVDVFGL